MADRPAPQRAGPLGDGEGLNEGVVGHAVATASHPEVVGEGLQHADRDPGLLLRLGERDGTAQPLLGLRQ